MCGRLETIRLIGGVEREADGTWVIAPILLVAWSDIEVLQHGAWIGPLLVAALLRQQGLAAGHLACLHLGAKNIKRERRRARNSGTRRDRPGRGDRGQRCPYDNVMIEVSGQGARIVYRERIPVPVSMWQPWTSGGATANFFVNPVVEFSGTWIAPLICYEQLLVWPVLQSMLFDPQVIGATGNGWWTGKTGIVESECSGCPWCLPLTSRGIRDRAHWSSRLTALRWREELGRCRSIRT
ncbi:DUF1612 domain-containing protein [Mesorhizobium sp. AaZ16]|uniref:DUF1612 domain-containing protein n=1 Tax=Mesorhizobium sp. AaZ16 TaxID=3402289 RepID=UPI00374FA7C5